MEIPTVQVDEVPDPMSQSVQILDVREPHEWDEAHIEGATHIPLGVVPVRANEIDPQQRTYVICHLGGRSAQATAWLQQQGYDAVNVAGGMDAWIAANRPTV